MSLPTLTDAISWLAEHWTPREFPNRIHSRDTGEDGAPAYHPAFLRYLNASPDDVTQMTNTRTCSHTRLPRNADEWTCPDCQGAGTYESTTLVYRYPMWRAMSQLGSTHKDAHDVVLTLVVNAYSVDDLDETLGITKPMILQAIRALRGAYLQSPSRDRAAWVDKSDSQRRAESLATNGPALVA